MEQGTTCSSYVQHATSVPGTLGKAAGKLAGIWEHFTRLLQFGNSFCNVQPPHTWEQSQCLHTLLKGEAEERNNTECRVVVCKGSSLQWYPSPVLKTKQLFLLLLVVVVVVVVAWWWCPSI